MIIIFFSKSERSFLNIIYYFFQLPELFLKRFLLRLARDIVVKTFGNHNRVFFDLQTATEMAKIFLKKYNIYEILYYWLIG